MDYMSLPEDVRLRVMGSLPRRGLLDLGASCSQMQALVYSPALWRGFPLHLDLDRVSDKDGIWDVLRQLVDRIPGLVQTVELRNVYNYLESVSSLLRHVGSLNPNITSLTLDNIRGDITGPLLEVIGHLPRLQRVTLRHCDIYLHTVLPALGRLELTYFELLPPGSAVYFFSADPDASLS